MGVRLIRGSGQLCIAEAKDRLKLVEAGTTVRLLLAKLTWKSKRLLGAMVLDRLDVESLSTRAEFPDRCQRFVNGLDSAI